MTDVEEIPLDSEGIPAAPDSEVPVSEPIEEAIPEVPKKKAPRPKPAIKREAAPKKQVKVEQPKKRGRPPKVPVEEDSEDEPPYTSPGLDTLAVAADVLRLLSAQKATRMEQKREQYRSWIL